MRCLTNSVLQKVNVAVESIDYKMLSRKSSTSCSSSCSSRVQVAVLESVITYVKLKNFHL